MRPGGQVSSKSWGWRAIDKDVLSQVLRWRLNDSEVCLFVVFFGGG